MSVKHQNWFTSLFTDKEWDADPSKVIGWLCVLASFVGFFLKFDSFQWLLGAGITLITTGKIKEG